MKILLDECIDVRFRDDIPGHQVFTVEYMNWKGIGNGRLLSLAAENGFEVFVTVDRGTLDQLPLPLPIALIVLRAKRSSRSVLAQMIPKLLSALSSLAPGSTTFVD